MSNYSENTLRRCHSSFKTSKIQSNRLSLWSPRERKRNEALHSALKRHWWSNGSKWRAFSSRTNINTPRAISQCSISPNCSASAAEAWLKVERYKILPTCRQAEDVDKQKRVRMQHCLSILYNGDTFYDFIFKYECSVKIERYTSRSSSRFGFVLF